MAVPAATGTAFPYGVHPVERQVPDREPEDEGRGDMAEDRAGSEVRRRGPGSEQVGMHR
ncbi:hypothetical protein HDA37_002940 [Pseudonocardia antarctica]|uniref:Uncharacterized protein n=1 Tax=Pseudonocardia alni TaxID=33907 RepID=A0A852W8M6_PSEA5|nr:hypothetical protein [Pseudonocardia antarctica]